MPFDMLIYLLHYNFLFRISSLSVYLGR